MGKPKSTYKWCFVPLCTSTSIATPNKVFVSVPSDIVRRRAWFAACRRDENDKKHSLTSALFCCEDHFDMHQDMENYLRYRLMGGGYLKSKKDAIPHIFDCQPQGKTRSFYTNQMISESSIDPSTLLKTFRDGDQRKRSNGELPSSSTRTREVGIQARVRYRSKSVMCKPSQFPLPQHSCTSLVKRVVEDANMSTIKFPCAKKKRFSIDDIFTDSSGVNTEHDDVCNSVAGGASSTIDDDNHTDDSVENDIKVVCLQLTRYSCERYSMLYLGLPSDSWYIINLLAKRIIFKHRWLRSEDVVLLILRKIRLNEPFEILALNFSISSYHCARLFSKYSPLIAHFMKQLIIWPNSDSIHRLLPTSFQKRYNKIQSIIDFFELEIEEPTVAINQAVTWSDYKKCNTLKYLISSTPDGVIHFVSKGYGGRVSEIIVLENSGYLDNLSEGMEVMACRGFKHIEKAIVDKKCKLVRLPSALQSTIPNAKECKKTKLIASLRFNVGQVIRRIREFYILAPHASVDIHMLPSVDHCVVIALGLINLQRDTIE